MDSSIVRAPELGVKPHQLENFQYAEILHGYRKGQIVRRVGPELLLIDKCDKWAWGCQEGHYPGFRVKPLTEGDSFTITI